MGVCRGAALDSFISSLTAGAHLPSFHVINATDNQIHGRLSVDGSNSNGVLDRGETQHVHKVFEARA